MDFFCFVCWSYCHVLIHISEAINGFCASRVFVGLAVQCLSEHPREQSSILSATCGNNEVAVWNMESGSRTKAFWGCSSHPLRPQRVKYSGSFGWIHKERNFPHQCPFCHGKSLELFALKSYHTDSPSQSESLRFIDSANHL